MILVTLHRPFTGPSWACALTHGPQEFLHRCATGPGRPAVLSGTLSAVCGTCGTGKEEGLVLVRRRFNKNLRSSRALVLMTINLLNVCIYIYLVVICVVMDKYCIFYNGYNCNSNLLLMEAPLVHSEEDIYPLAFFRMDGVSTVILAAPGPTHAV